MNLFIGSAPVHHKEEFATRSIPALGLTLALAALLLLMAEDASLGATDDSRRVVQADEILAKIERGENLDGVIVEGDLDLSERALGAIHFNNTIFLGSVNFKNTTFTGNAWFMGSNFSDYAVFSGAEFSGGNAEFSFAKFSGGYTEFSNSEFSGGDANFIFAEFSSGYSSFSQAKFSGGKAYFMNSKFSGGHTYFSQAMFSGGDASFSEAVFSGGSAKFWMAVFSGGDASFREVAFSGGDADFWNATFSGGDAYFSGAVFSGGYADFSDADFYGGDAYFSETEFTEDALFENVRFTGEFSLTRARYNKLYIRWHNIEGGLAYDDAAYLSLLKNFKELGYFEDYDSCYFEYRKERRNQPWPLVGYWEEAFRKKIDLLLEWFYGYGTKPVNALYFSIGIIILFWGFWWFIGLGSRPEYILDEYSKLDTSLDQIHEVLLFSATVFLSGTRLFIEPPSIPKIGGRSRSMVRCAFIFERVLGALFSILFFLAISGTVVRQL